MSDTPRTDKAANESILAVYEESKQLERELAAANQIMGELCESCGWAMRFPDQPCRCELERDLAEARDQLAGAGKLMKACDVLVRELAEAWNQRDTLAEALDRIADLCQMTCMSFETQSFRATEIAIAALAAVKGGTP
jgi:hypothetical protein